MTSHSAREGLIEQITMVREGIAYCLTTDEPPSDRQYALLTRYEAQLEAMHGDGPMETTPVLAKALTNRRAGGAKAGNQFGTFTVHHATPKQTAFIKRLMDTRDLTQINRSALVVAVDVEALRLQVASGTVSKRTSSNVIDRLLACPEVAIATPVGPAKVSRPASSKQTALITRLAGEKDWASLAVAPTVQAVLGSQPVEMRDASDAITALISANSATQHTATAEPLEAGMYRAANGDLIRVYFGKQSGRMLAKQVVGNPEDGYEFEYLGQAFRFVAPADRMSLDEAKAWGRVTSTCCVCAAHLDDPTSVAAGIGPVCASRV